MATLFLTPRVQVYVNGILRRSVSGTTSCGFRSSFSTASIAFAADEDPAVPGDKIAVELGYVEKGIQIVFTGEADDDTLAYWPTVPGVQATGVLSRLQRGLGYENTSATPNEETGEYPAFEAVGATDQNIVLALLDAYGIPAGDVQGMTPETTFGNIHPFTLGKDEAAWAKISELDRLTFMRTFDAPDGTARRLPINGIPGSAALTLVQGVDIKDGASRSRSRRGIVNSVTMSGLQDAAGPGLTPRATRQADSPYIPTPPRYQSESWQSQLAETEEMCDAYAASRLGQTNRLSENVSIPLSRCRPDIYPAMSLAISSSVLGYNASTVFWVEQVDHNWNSTGIGTVLGLIAATAADGLNPNQKPIAIINVRIERETLGDSTTIWVVYADGSASYDPDGVAIDLDPQHGIATYLWSGSPNGPSTPAGKPRATYVYTSDPTGATITLVVTDTSLKTGTATHTLSATEVTNAGRRDLWAAVEADLFLTTDGGISWRPTGVPAVAIAAMAHPLYQLAAETSGALHRVTVNSRGVFVVEDIASPSNVTALHINLGIDGTGTHRCWAGCNGGETWLSTDDGQTWVARGTIPNVVGSSGPAVRHIEESPYSFGTLYAISGPAMWLSFDEGVTWTSVRQYPDVALTATAFASGRFADLSQDKSFHWATFAGTSANAEQRLLEQADTEEVDWPVASKPAQPSGLTMGAQAPELYLTDTVGTGRSWYIEDFTGGGELVERAYDAAFGLPRHIIRDPDFDGIVYGAAENTIFKTFDKFVSVAALLTLGAGLYGHMVGYGKLRLPLPVRGDLVWVGSTAGSGADRWVYRLTADGFSRTAHPLAGGPTPAICSLVQSTSGALFTWAWKDDRLPVGSTNAYRSTDGGLTWTALPLSYVYEIRPGPEGVVYASLSTEDHDHPTQELHRSDDNGATWATVHSIAGNPTIRAAYNALAVSPIDPLTVISKGYWPGDIGGVRGGFKISTNGGATFADMNIPTGDQAALERGQFVAFSPAAGHMMWFRQLTSPFQLRRAAASIGASTSDVGTLTSQDALPSVILASTIYFYGAGIGVMSSADNGATWTTVLDDARYPGPANTIVGFAPGDDNNDWYALGLGSYALARRSVDADAADLWEDLTPTLLALFPDGAYVSHFEGALRLTTGG